MANTSTEESMLNMTLCHQLLTLRSPPVSLTPLQILTRISTSMSSPYFINIAAVTMEMHRSKPTLMNRDLLRLANCFTMAKMLDVDAFELQLISIWNCSRTDKYTDIERQKLTEETSNEKWNDKPFIPPKKLILNEFHDFKWIPCQCSDLHCSLFLRKKQVEIG